MPCVTYIKLFLGVASEQGEEGKENWEESSCVDACSKHQIIALEPYEMQFRGSAIVWN